jgi:hypothetical protein
MRLLAVASLSFAAVTWCAEQGIAVLLLDRHGAVMSAFFSCAVRPHKTNTTRSGLAFTWA